MRQSQYSGNRNNGSNWIDLLYSHVRIYVCNPIYFWSNEKMYGLIWMKLVVYLLFIHTLWNRVRVKSTINMDHTRYCQPHTHTHWRYTLAHNHACKPAFRAPTARDRERERAQSTFFSITGHLLQYFFSIFKAFFKYLKSYKSQKRWIADTLMLNWPTNAQNVDFLFALLRFDFHLVVATNLLMIAENKFASK